MFSFFSRRKSSAESAWGQVAATSFPSQSTMSDHLTALAARVIDSRGASESQKEIFRMECHRHVDGDTLVASGNCLRL